MTVPAKVASFITEQREVLSRLEQFARTPQYQRLLAAVVPMAFEDPEPWLSQYLIEPAIGLSGRPIDALNRPGGVEIVERHLLWIAACIPS